MFDGYVSYGGTLGGDVLTIVKGVKNGITIFNNSNSPSNRPTGCDWGAYVVFRNGTQVSIIYMDKTKFACTYSINTDASTSITWKVI